MYAMTPKVYFLLVAAKSQYHLIVVVLVPSDCSSISVCIAICHLCIMVGTAIQRNEAASTAYIDDSAVLFLVCGFVVKGHGHCLASFRNNTAGVTSICHQQGVTLHLQQQFTILLRVSIDAADTSCCCVELEISVCHTTSSGASLCCV